MDLQRTVIKPLNKLFNRELESFFGRIICAKSWSHPTGHTFFQLQLNVSHNILERAHVFVHVPSPNSKIQRATGGMRGRIKMRNETCGWVWYDGLAALCIWELFPLCVGAPISVCPGWSSAQRDGDVFSKQSWRLGEWKDERRLFFLISRGFN